MQPRGYAPISNTKDNPPCNTLFIGNLGDGVNEAEIRGLFRCAKAGFRWLCWAAASQLAQVHAAMSLLLHTQPPTPALPSLPRSHQPGFQQLKLVRGPKGVTCFIEFIDVPSAMAVHDAQQGAILASSDRGGIRIQYSKNPFGRKRDAAGAFVDPGSAAAAPGGGMYGGRGEPHAADTPAQQPGQPQMPAATL